MADGAMRESTFGDITAEIQEINNAVSTGDGCIHNIESFFLGVLPPAKEKEGEKAIVLQGFKNQTLGMLRNIKERITDQNRALSRIANSCKEAD